MQVAVLGANGMLGRYVYKYLSTCYDVTPITRKEFDVLIDPIDKIDWSKFDWVINCIGAIPQKCYLLDEYWSINVYYPMKLQLECINYDTKILGISSDCRNDNTEYGKSKKASEKYNDSTIITSIIGEGGGLLQDVINGNITKGYINHHWNGVTCLELAEEIGQTLSSSFSYDKRILFSKEIFNKYELCNLIAQIYNVDVMILPEDTNEVNRVMTKIDGYECEVIDTPLIDLIKKQKDYDTMDKRNV